MEADQLFPLGDNSPQSSDARMWDEAFRPARSVDRQGAVDLLAASLVSPHPVLAQFQTHATDSLIAGETTGHGGRPR